MVTSAIGDIERYEVIRSLGSGGLGVVYEAVDRDSGATVAIKTLHDVTPDALYRLKREFRLLQGLEHANVCQHYELFEHGGQWFITMECVRGEHILHAVRDDDGNYDEVWLRDALRQLAEALCALHGAGLVHRDVKPSNVLVEPSGRVVLLDFGFVEASRLASQQRSQSIVGTPLYMAPEQAVHSQVGPAADWYSFGVILFEALTKTLPHEGETALAIMINKQHGDAPRASSLVPGVPADLDELCADLLRTDPAQRPSGEAVLRRLGRAGRDSRVMPNPSQSIASTFIGRGDELAVLRGAFEDLAKEHAISVVVEGPSGVGKSALVRHFSDDVVARGALVLAGRCYERESVPYKAFDSVVDTLARYLRRLPDAEVAALLPRHPDLLVRMFPVLGAVPAMAAAPPARAPLGDPHEQRNQAFGALREMLHRLAQRRRLVISIDDWQWADADSVVLARDLVRHRDSPPMLVVLTVRPAQDEEIMARLDAVAALDARRIDLGALVEEQAIELVGQLKRSFAPSLDLDLAAIVRETQGHPLYISELVRYAATRGSSDSTTPIRLDEAILARIAELPPEARAIVNTLAVAGEPLPLDIVREVVDLEPAVVQRHAAMLRVAHLVRTGHAEGSLEPYHDRVREAVLDGMEPAKRLIWHRRIAYAVEASPLARVRPELLLRHLDIAGEAARAAEIAIAAAQRAVVAGAFDQAATLFAIALRGTLDDGRRRLVRIEMGQALANAGRGHEAAETFLAVAAEADPAMRLDCHRLAAEQLMMSGDLERGLKILGELLADVDVTMPATQKRALVSVIFRRAALGLRGLGWKERRATEVAPETLLRLDVLKAASHTLALVDNIRAADFNVRLLLLSLKVGERSRCAIALASEAVYQSSSGGGRGVDRARALVETVRKLSADSNDPRLRAFVLMSEGAVEYWVLRLSRAESLLREAERVFREESTGTNLEHKTSRMFLAYALRQRGSWAQLRELLDEYVEDADRRGDRYVTTSMNRYCSPLWLAADEPEHARRILAEAKWILPTNAFHAQHWYELEARGEIAIYERTVERDLPELEPLFEGLGRSVLLRVSSVFAGAMWLRGRLALHTGKRSDVQQAIRKLARFDNPRAQIISALLEAGLAGRTHDTVAVAKLREVIALATERDLRLHAAAARYQLGGLLGAGEGSELVTRAVEAMAAEGVKQPARFADWFVPGFQK